VRPSLVGGSALLVDLTAAGLPLSSVSLFGRPCPLEVELGSGKGRFLLAWATAHPDIGILAVERARKYAELAAARAARQGLGNVKIAATTAEDLMFRCLLPGSVGGFHIYFPDPWPKKKHQKRRFFRPDNLQRLVDLLQPGGMLWVKTDHPAYAAVIGPLLAAQAGIERLDEVEAFAALPATNFEVKYAREDRPIHRFAYRRI
jgi:tRNA (guanine-N7-)-methyltransferase